LRLISTSRYILGQCRMLSPERILPHLPVYYDYVRSDTGIGCI
jgi:hypothetical protein